MRVPSIVVPALLLALASVVLAPSALASHEAVVYLTASGFSPGSLAIASGDRVRFTVRDHKAHQIAKTTGPGSGDVPPTVLEGQGSSVTLMPTEPGTYTYIDRLNPQKPEFRVTLRR
ncbi:MAG TPA: cupredoxin domain-containing protein [Candidatus Elarobacter sp.]|jgi:plastocyanin|nr:cupredoxin domain-containing protein [Candidatus Elarobacter sp.]